MSAPDLEVWLRGPVEGIPSLLQPIAHALLQSREEVNALMKNFSSAYLWERPDFAASAGFHLQHLAGVLDRLFTYASGNQLNEFQLQQLASEGKMTRPDLGLQQLLTLFNEQVDKAMAQLAGTDESTLLEARGVGRAQLPSNVIGLLFHAAEHVQRHTGQLLVTVKFLERRVRNNL